MLPFYHSGMGRILPKHCVLPRAGNTVHVTVGEPIDLKELTSRCNCEQYKQSEVILCCYEQGERHVLTGTSGDSFKDPPRYSKSSTKQSPAQIVKNPDLDLSFK